MKTENKELLPESPIFKLTPRLRTIFKTENIIRRSDFSAFMFPCIFKQNNSFVAIATHEIPNALKFFFFHYEGLYRIDTFYPTPEAKLELKNFFKSGSLKFPLSYFLGDDTKLQLPPEVLAFFS